MSLIQPNNRPKQKLSFKNKGKTWGEKNMDWADNLVFQNYSFVRKNFNRKYVNYKLWQGDLSLSDMKALLGPHTFDFQFTPEEIQHYPIVTPLINILLGEEAERATDWKVIVTNPDAISDMEERKIQQVQETMMMLLQQNYQDEESLNQAFEEKAQYFKYSYQDLLEVRANWLFNHYVKELDVKNKINKGFFNTLVVGEELYQCDVVSDEPTFEVLNPMKTHVLLSGYSNLIEDADVIVYQDHMSPGAIVDTYHEYLTPSDIDYIEGVTIGNNTDDMSNTDPTAGFAFIGEEAEFIQDNEGSSSLENALGLSRLSGFYTRDLVDINGNIRVLKVYWKSFKQLLLVGFIDEETGEYYEEYMPEDYIVNQTLGEKLIKKVWVNHAYEGVKIGDKVYPYIRPRRIQYNTISNPSKCKLGITGVISSYNEFRAISFMDRIKPYQYMYDIVWARINDALAKDIGNAYELDIAKLPKGMDELDWYYFLLKNKIALADSFKEGEGGPAKGKLAGQMNTIGKPLNLSQANYIEYNIKLLEFLKMEMSYISGITPQRMGSMKSTETMGGIERSVLQSSYSTEPYFAFHYAAVRSALQTLLDTIVFAMGDNKKKLRHIADDMTDTIYEIDGKDIRSMDLGIMVDITGNSSNLRQKLEQLAHAAMQNQMISMSGLVKMYNATSLAAMEKILEVEEENARRIAQEQAQGQMQAEQARTEAQAALEQQKLQVDVENNVRDNQTKIEVEAMKLIEKAKEVQNTDYTDLDREELQLKKNKLQGDLQKMVQDYTLANKQHKETVRHNKATEGISKNKSTSK
jgi:hypothetical protein